MEILQKFVAFSEYTNFTILRFSNSFDQSCEMILLAGLVGLFDPLYSGLLCVSQYTIDGILFTQIVQ